MNSLSTTLFLLVLSLGLHFSSCLPEPEVQITCLNGYVEADNNFCICPDGSLELGSQRCLELKENDYIVEATECLCEEAFIITFGDTGVLITAGPSGSSEFIIDKSDYYTVRTDGDEVVLEGLLNWPCVEPTDYQVYLEGKFNTEGTEMLATVSYVDRQDPDVPAETCTVIIRK